MSHLIKDGKIQVLSDKHECQSVIYAVAADSTAKAKDSQTILKGLEIWYDGYQPFRTSTNNEDADKALRREARIYDMLGVHSRLITYHGLELLPDTQTAWAIRLERAAFGSLRKVIVEEVAEGVAYVHSRGGIWSDASTRNVLLCDSRGGDPVAKLCDFGGSAPESEHDQDWYACETPPGPNPHDHPRGHTRARELFALGSITYEITHWAVPYGAKTHSDNIDRAVADGNWPALDQDNPALHVVKKCWAFEYASADEVAADLSRIAY